MNTTGKLQVIDSRTGRSYELPITDGAIRAFDLRQIRTSEDDFGLLSYDQRPASISRHIRCPGKPAAARVSRRPLRRSADAAA